MKSLILDMSGLNPAQRNYVSSVMQNFLFGVGYNWNATSAYPGKIQHTDRPAMAVNRTHPDKPDMKPLDIRLFNAFDAAVRATEVNDGSQVFDAMYLDECVEFMLASIRAVMVMLNQPSKELISFSIEGIEICIHPDGRVEFNGFELQGHVEAHVKWQQVFGGGRQS